MLFLEAFGQLLPGERTHRELIPMWRTSIALSERVLN